MYKVTIITATYNSAATVRETLASVASQNYSNIEHIIIDGKSTDDTLSIVNDFPHVAKIVSEKDDGIYDAMNKGIALSTGDIIGILNSDDVYMHKDVISIIVNGFEKTGCEALYADLLFVNQQDTQKITRVWRAGSYKPNHFLFGWMPPHPTFFVKKEVYNQYGVFDTFFRFSADYELMLRFIHKFHVKLHYIPEIIVRFRKGGASTASFKNRFKANVEDKRAWIRNGMEPSWFTILLKPTRKLRQYFRWFRSKKWSS